jgi:hypothetical protein
MTTITLTLPDQTMQQAQQAALAVRKPVEELLMDVLATVFPSISDTPADLQAELTRMTWLSNQRLWEFAHGMMSLNDQRKLQQLTSIQEEHELTGQEQVKLDELRQEYGRITLLKARAYALLSLRGGELLLERI